MHLAAAGLRVTKFDAMTKALENLDGGLPGPWEDGVVEASDEQGEMHARSDGGFPPHSATAGRSRV